MAKKPVTPDDNKEKSPERKQTVLATYLRITSRRFRFRDRAISNKRPKRSTTNYGRFRFCMICVQSGDRCRKIVAGTQQ